MWVVTPKNETLNIATASSIGTREIVDVGGQRRLRGHHYAHVAAWDALLAGEDRLGMGQLNIVAVPWNEEAATLMPLPGDLDQQRVVLVACQHAG